MSAYYNEVDPYAAQWLRNLIAAGEIVPGDVDTRSISDVQPSDLEGYTQCHFFAGIGIWSRALRTTGWDDTRPVWTGSCPCQPFSAAGAAAGFADERHLWPHWHWLIEQCRPETIFGEQVASSDGLVWADLVSADLEAADYALGIVDTCAAGFRSFHIRQRLYFAAHDCRSAASQSWQDLARGFGGMVNPGRPRSATWLPEALGKCEGHTEEPDHGMCGLSGPNTGRPQPSGMADNESQRRERRADPAGPHRRADAERCGTFERLADQQGHNRRLAEGRSGKHLPEPAGSREAGRVADSNRQPERGGSGQETGAPGSAQGKVPGQKQQWHGILDVRDCADLRPGPADGYWRDADWLFCRDGVWRPVEAGTFPLAHENPARMGRLRAYGNGLDLAQATGFVSAYLQRDLANLTTNPAADLFEWSA